MELLNYFILYDAVEKLEEGSTLFTRERNELLRFLKSIQGHTIPSKQRLEKYHENIELLASTGIRNPKEADRMVNENIKLQEKWPDISQSRPLEFEFE